MELSAAAYRLRVLFDSKITAYYQNSFKGEFGRAQADALSLLYDRKALRVQEIADTLGIPKQHASKIMTKLEAMKLVARGADPADKRSVFYHLTDQGLSLMYAHLSASNRNFEQMMSRLSSDDQTRLAEAMAVMIDLLEKM